MRKERTSSDIKVEFRLEGITESKTKTYPLFWKRSDNILIYADGVQSSQVAKAVAKGLLESRAYKDLAEWVDGRIGGVVTLPGSKITKWGVPPAD